MLLTAVERGRSCPAAAVAATTGTGFDEAFVLTR
jgi:hypothetical protein